MTSADCKEKGVGARRGYFGTLVQYVEVSIRRDAKTTSEEQLRRKEEGGRMKEGEGRRKEKEGLFYLGRSARYVVHSMVWKNGRTGVLFVSN